MIPMTIVHTTTVPTTRWVVLAAFLLMVVSNILSSLRVYGGNDNKVLSDKNPTFVSPDGTTFAVWGLIYLFESITVTAQAIPAERTEELLGQRCPILGLDVRERMAIAFLCNAVWLPCFNYEVYLLALAVMAVYLALLISLYGAVNVLNTVDLKERVFFAVGIALNTSWIIVATFVNLFVCVGRAGWTDPNGVAGSVAAAHTIIFLVAGLGAGLGLCWCDLAFSGVSAWALRGIYRMQTVVDPVRYPPASMKGSLASSAMWGSYAVLLCMLLGMVYAAVVRLGPKGQAQ